MMTKHTGRITGPLDRKAAILEQSKEGLMADCEKYKEQLRRMERALRLAELDTGVSVESDTVEDAQIDRVGAILEFSVDLWDDNVIEPAKSGDPANSAGDIDTFIRLPLCANWHWLEPYTHNGQTAWCGFAQSYAFRAAGLKAHIVEKVLPSCYRLKKFARENNRFVDVADMKPGDIVLVDSTGDGKANHITLCWGAVNEVWPDEFYDAIREIDACEYTETQSTYVTLEGNAKGLLPDGRIVEGYVARTRPLEQVTHVIRFQEADYE